MCRCARRSDDLRKLHPDEIRLVLPAPGDPRGLPGPGTPFTGAALLAGEGWSPASSAWCPRSQPRLRLRRHVLHRAVALPRPARTAPASGDEPSPAEAEAELPAALAEATARLSRLDVAQWRPELAERARDAPPADFGCELPPVYDPRARRLFARASVLDRMLALADQSAPGGAVNVHEARQRDEALRPLLAACRRALVAACNARLVG